MGLSWNSKVRHLPARELFLAGRGFGCSAGRRGVRRGVAAGPQPVLSTPSAGRSCWRRTSDSVAWTSPGARPSGVLRLRRLLFRLSVHRSGQSEGEFISLGHFEQLDLQAGTAGTAGVAGTCLGAFRCPSVQVLIQHLRNLGARLLGLWGRHSSFCLQRRHPPSTYPFQARSMGAVTAILRAAEDSGISALVLDSPFSAEAAKSGPRPPRGPGPQQRVQSKATCPWWPRSWSKAAGLFMDTESTRKKKRLQPFFVGRSSFFSSGQVGLPDFLVPLGHSSSRSTEHPWGRAQPLGHWP